MGKAFQMLPFYMWHTNSIRIIVKPDRIAVQLWVNQEIKEEQWKKLDFIISLLENPEIAYDIVTYNEDERLLKMKNRYFLTVSEGAKGKRNSYHIRKVYTNQREKLRKIEG